MRYSLICLLAGAMSLSMFGCDNPRICQAGEYRNFVPDWTRGYQVDSNGATIWMVAEGNSCLPRDVTVKNVAAPAECKVGFQPPGWIKGSPSMAVYLDGFKGAETSVSFDLYQGAEKKQTVKVEIRRTTDSRLILIVDGKQLEPNKSE